MKTRIEEHFSTTWLLVKTCPAALTKNPDPDEIVSSGAGAGAADRPVSGGRFAAPGGNRRGHELARIDCGHSQRALPIAVEARSPYVTAPAAELEDGQAKTRRFAEISKEVEEHSFCHAPAFCEFGEACGIEGR